MQLRKLIVPYDEDLLVRLRAATWETKLPKEVARNCYI